ncbi:hypothetical protein [Agromyces humatus]|uniref:hypothetical protein n=1 Tax=Agromyces humatus TaxID=279573 RepID=UPI001E4953B7|nr:hypothetical protein [Agromyces humatus]
MSFTLSGDEALILFEWLAAFNQRSETQDPEHQVLYNLEAVLERNPVTTFLPNHAEWLEKARARFMAEFEPPDGSDPSE